VVPAELVMSAGLAAAIRSRFTPFRHEPSGVAADPQNCINQMNRSIDGTYWMTWSQHRPLSRKLPAASLVGLDGNILVGSSVVKVAPASVE